MSDGITDSFRDTRIIEKIEKIRNLEEGFNKKDSIELAQQIIEELNILKKMKRGYWNTVNPKVIEQDIITYQNYLDKHNYRG